MKYVIIYECLILLTYGIYVFLNRPIMDDMYNVLGVTVVFTISLVVNWIILHKYHYKFPGIIGGVIAFISAILFGGVIPQVFSALRYYHETGYWHVEW